MAPAQQQSICEYAPTSAGAEDYERLVTAIERRLESPADPGAISGFAAGA